MKQSDDTSYRRNPPKVFTSAVVAAVVVAVAILTVLLSARPVATAGEPAGVDLGACRSAGGSLEVPPGGDVNIWAGWIAHESGLIADYLSAVDQSLSVDGTPIANANDLYGPVVDAGDLDGDGDSEFATYWNLTLDPLEPGQTHVIDLSVGLTHRITDGGDYDGDGLPDWFGPGENLWNLTCALTATPTPAPTPAPETTGPAPVDQGGGTASTGTTPTASDPLETSVTVPAGTSGGTVTISEGPVTTSQTGFTLVGQQVVITTDITGTTASNPLVIVFNLDASVIPAGENQDTIAIFKDGTSVPNCLIFTGSTVADHDPCVSNRELLAGGDIRITVLTTTASTWQFGVAVATPSPTPTATPAGAAWGDIDCLNGVTIGDAQKIARDLIDLAISQGPGCRQVGSPVGGGGGAGAGTDLLWGDIDCLNGVTIGDAQKIARDLIDLAITQGPGCPLIGERT